MIFIKLIQKIRKKWKKERIYEKFRIYRIAYKNALEYAAGSPVMGKKNFDDNDIFDIF